MSNESRKLEQLLRSFLVGDKDGIPLERLERDFCEIMGVPIPFVDMGFPSLEEYLKGSPCLCKIKGGIVYGIADSSMAHVGSLIQGQRNSNSKNFNRQLQPISSKKLSTTSYVSTSKNLYSKGKSSTLATPVMKSSKTNVVAPPPIKKNGTDAVTIPSGTVNPQLTSNTNNVIINPQAVVCQPQASSFMEKLLAYQVGHGYTEVLFKVVLHKRSKAFFASLKLWNDKCYRTFPIECKTPSEAKEMVAEIAWKDLNIFVDEKLDCPSSSNNLICERILHLLGPRKYGIFKKDLPKLYREEYKEDLPIQWTELVENYPRLKIDTMTYGNSSCFIIMPRNPELPVDHHSQPASFDIPSSAPLNSSLFLTSLPTSTANEESLPLSITSIPLSTISPPSSTASVAFSTISSPMFSASMTSLQSILISHLSSAHYVYIRFMDSASIAVFEDVRCRMDSGDYSRVVCSPDVEQVYATFHYGSWCRVKCSNENCNEDGLLTCWHIDSGYTFTLPPSDLYYIEDELLRTVPAQTQRVILAGFEDNNLPLSLRRKLLGKLFQARLFGSLIILYDFAGSNMDFHTEILLQYNQPSSSQENSICSLDGVSVLISHITNNCIYVQRTDTDDIFNMIATLIEEELATNKPNLCDIDARLFLAPYYKDGKYYRAKLLTQPDTNGMIDAFFVDFGNHEIVKADEAYHINSGLLLSLKYQAHKCCLLNMLKSAGDSTLWNSLVFKNLRNLIPEEESVLLRFSEKDNTVQLYSSSNSNKSLNEILAGSEINSKIGNILTREECSVSLCDLGRVPLKAFEVPKVNELFDVNVSLVVNPSNFVIQPWGLSLALEQQQEEMLLVYNDLSALGLLSSLTSSDLSLDEFYAYFYEVDKCWYRVRLTHSAASLFTGRFVDYGHSQVELDIKNIQPLYAHFRKLPMQAINAGLAGITSTADEWNSDDCAWFTSCCYGFQFVATVVSSSSNFLWVTLCDTSDEFTDVYIHKKMLAEKRAFSKSLLY